MHIAAVTGHGFQSYRVMVVKFSCPKFVPNLLVQTTRIVECAVLLVDITRN